MKILAIESSCDETAAAVVHNGHKVLSSVIASQMAKHAETGGVVPEVAAREHVKSILPTVRQAMTLAGTFWDDIDAIAVTTEPGLVGSLMVGISTASALAFGHEKPLIHVNHIQGHWYSAWLEADSTPEFPILLLSVSGGHNQLVFMRSHSDYKVLGETLDDAAGEAFDKVARLLRLGYPGGPAIEREARLGSPKSHRFPRTQIPGYNFSFSGLKTSVLYHVQANEDQLAEPGFVQDTAAAFQEAVLDMLVSRVVQASKALHPKEIHVVGGVSANQALRLRLEKNIPGETLLRYPKTLAYCTDNAAMIGAAAFHKSKPLL